MMRRREFITLLVAIAAWPVATRGQQSLPVIGFLTTSSVDAPSGPIPAILLALRHAGFEAGQTVRMDIATQTISSKGFPRWLPSW